MDKKKLLNFCDQWLLSWRGNQPYDLYTFYHPDATYIDPGLSKPLVGSDDIFDYLSKLLAKNPDWKWNREEIFFYEQGFILKWKAEIPVKDKVLVTKGLDIVELKDNLIIRNEVYFDPKSLTPV